MCGWHFIDNQTISHSENPKFNNLPPRETVHKGGSREQKFSCVAIYRNSKILVTFREGKMRRM